MEYSSEHQRARALLIQSVCVFCVPIFTFVFTCVCFLSPTKQNPKHTPSREARHITVGRVHPLEVYRHKKHRDGLTTQKRKRSRTHTGLKQFNKYTYIHILNASGIEYDSDDRAGLRGYVCVCVFSSHPFWTSSSLDVPAGVTQEEGHTGFLIHLPSAVRALIFVARRIQPFLSLVDREVEFCVLTN